MRSGNASRSKEPPNSLLEQPAPAARPWQEALGKIVAPGEPRPGPRPPLLTAHVIDEEVQAR